MRADLPFAKQTYELTEQVCNFKDERKIKYYKIINRDEKYLPDIIIA